MMQSFFNQIARHLLTQNAVAKLNSCDEDSMCAYRGVGGMKCAFGAIIPDEIYDPLLEGNGVNMLLLEPIGNFSEPVILHVQALRDWINTYKYGASLKDPEFAERLVGMLQELQYIHDVGKVNLWRTQLAFVAGKYGLNNEVPLYFKAPEQIS